MSNVPRHASIKDIRKAFRGNMRAMGLPVPDAIWKRLKEAIGALSAMGYAIAKHGNKVLTVAGLAGVLKGTATGITAAFLVEAAAVAGGLLASYYVGACIMSLFLAIGQASPMGKPGFKISSIKREHIKQYASLSETRILYETLQCARGMDHEGRAFA